MPADILALARRYRDLGLSVVPVTANGQKRPALASWKEYQRRLATDRELEEWFGNGHVVGIGLVCGRVSNGLEVLDFDDGATFQEWKCLVDTLAPGLLARLPCVRTPRGGVHVYLFHGQGQNVRGNRKLARNAAGKEVIETRGEGGFVVAPGSPPECHPSGKTYEWERPLEG